MKARTLMASLGVNVAIIENGKILLTQREDFEYWVLPGGGVEAGESLAQAARREANEETGLEVALLRLVGFYYRPALPPWGGHIALFSACPVGGGLQPQPTEVVDEGFFDPDKLPVDHMPWIPHRIQDALAGVGGSVVWRLDRLWTFPTGLSNTDIYAYRDRSGLTKPEFYRQQVARCGLIGDVQEVPDDSQGKSYNMNISQTGIPGLAVNVAIIQDGQVLLMQREDYEVWGLPGGMVEDDESLVEAARREVLEEVGLQTELTRLVGVYSDVNLFGYGILFAGRVAGGELSVNPREGLQARFFDPHTLPKDLQFGTRRRVKDAFSETGGSRVWRQDISWLFPAGLGRRELYAMRDRSGLGRASFFRAHQEKVAPMIEKLEL